MTKLTQIQNALRAINDARFQELCDRYLYREGYHHINRIGAVVGKDKTRKGRPDTLVSQPNGLYIMVESTTTEQSKLFNELMTDVESCFDEAKTGIPVEKIEKIILCHNSKLSGSETHALTSKGQEHGCGVETLGIDSLSFGLLEKHQGLAKEYLGIEIDTGQILSPADFVTLYQTAFATPLDLRFHRREKELNDALDALETYDLLIITGPAGVGKSRLALECMHKFVQRHRSYQPFCVVDKELALYEDLKVYVGNDGNYLLFVDDANRLSQLGPLLRLLHEQRENRHTKVILTVRDYAISDISKKVRAYASKAELQLQPFTDEEITEIIEAEFGIHNPRYLDQIRKIAGGNPRLAVMAATLARKTNKFNSIADASDLYDQYFASITDDLSELKTGRLLEVGGILAFFNSLDRTTEVFKRVTESFGFSEGEFWQEVERLHAVELVDIYETTDLVKISDQALATYLFYLVFFKLESANFSVLLSDYLPFYEYKFREAVYPLLEVFDRELILQRLQKHVDAEWRAANEDEAALLPLMRLFWFVKKTEILIYLKERIDSLPADAKTDFATLTFEPDAEGIKDKYLEVLEEFQHATIEDFRIAFQLILSYLEKRPSLLSQVLYILLERFSFDLKSVDYGYITQRVVIETLIQQSTDPETGVLYKRLLLRIAQNYLKTQFRSHQLKGLRVLIQEFRLLPSKELFELRKMLWGFITKETSEPETHDIALGLVHDHATRFHDTPVDKNTNKIVGADSEILLPFLSSTLDPSSYTDAVLMQHYLRFLVQHKVAVDGKLQERFTNEEYRLSQILFPEWSLDFEEQRSEAIKQEIADYSYRDWGRFLERCAAVQTRVTSDIEFHLLSSGIEMALLYLSETNVSLFKKVVKHILQTGNRLGHIYRVVIAKLRSSYSSPRYAYRLLKQYEYETKQSWLLTFLSQLTPDQVNHFYLGELYSLYRTADVRLFRDFDFLESYRGLDKDVVVNAVTIVFDRSQPGQLVNFHYLFNPHTYISKNLKSLFAENIELLEDVYLHQSAIDSLVNYGGLVLKSIVELDPDFITKYLEWLYGEQNYVSEPMDGARYEALWTLDDYESVITTALEFVFAKENSGYARSFNYANAFFRHDRQRFGSEIKPSIPERMETFISKYIQTHSQDRRRMIFIFDVIDECFPGKRLEYLKFFLVLNDDSETFERLAIQPNGWESEGSPVPVFKEKIEFLESILLLLPSSMSFLKHRRHIDNLIRDWKQRIEDENRNDFLR